MKICLVFLFLCSYLSLTLVDQVDSTSSSALSPSATRDPSIEERRRKLRLKFRRKWRQKLQLESERLANLSAPGLEPGAEVIGPGPDIATRKDERRKSDMVQLPAEGG